MSLSSSDGQQMSPNIKQEADLNSTTTPTSYEYPPLQSRGFMNEGKASSENSRSINEVFENFERIKR